MSDVSLIRLSPHAAATGESPFSPPHPYVSPHVEHYLRSVHSSPTLSMISHARGLSPADGEALGKYIKQYTHTLTHTHTHSIHTNTAYTHTLTHTAVHAR